jgi:hypothetical protein
MVASDLSGFCSIESGRAALLRGIPTRTGFSLVHLLQPFDNVRQNGSFSLLKFIVMNQFCGWNERKARVLMLGFLDNDQGAVSAISSTASVPPHPGAKS